MLKRLISGTLSAVMCVSAILADHPISRSGVPKSSTDSSSKQQNDDIGMQGVNSFGKFIANAADEDEGPSFGAALSSNDYSITSLEFDPASGVVSIASTQPDSVKVIVSFIDDETAENAFSLESKIEAGDHINTELKADISRLPEYYIIKAQLFDELNRPVGAPYSIKTYTKSIREVVEAEVSDFEQEYVVNLDEDETNNFLVLSEDTVRAESSENTNIVASADYDNNVFVFDNADETLNSLQEGEYLFVQPDEDNIIAVNVESVEVDGDTVTVKGNDDIDEMFDFIKLYTDGNLSDVELDPSNASEGVSFPDQNEGGELSVNEDGEIDVDYEYTSSLINDDYDTCLCDIEYRDNKVDEMVDALGERERRILTLYFGLGGERQFTLDEIGSELNLTGERVRQIMDMAIVKIRCGMLTSDDFDGLKSIYLES